MEKVKSFFRMVLAEIKMFTRNKAVLVIVLCMSAVIILLMSSFTQTTPVVSIAMNCEEQEVDSVAVYGVITEFLKVEKVVNVDTLEEGKSLVQRGEVTIFVNIDSSKKPETAQIFLDNTTVQGSTLKDKLFTARYTYAYDRIIEKFEEYGIKIDTDYFHLVKVSTANVEYSDFIQSLFAVEFAVCVACVLMIGIAYSTSRNFESAIGKNMRTSGYRNVGDAISTMSPTRNMYRRRYNGSRRI